MQLPYTRLSISISCGCYFSSYFPFVMCGRLHRWFSCQSFFKRARSHIQPNQSIMGHTEQLTHSHMQTAFNVYSYSFTAFLNTSCERDDALRQKNISRHLIYVDTIQRRCADVRAASVLPMPNGFSYTFSIPHSGIRCKVCWNWFYRFGFYVWRTLLTLVDIIFIYFLLAQSRNFS